MNISIRTTNLTKHFTQKTLWGAKKVTNAVEGVTLQVREGEIFGLVGPNQAGKTTLIKLLCTLILPTSGKALVKGYDTSSQQDKVKACIGLVAGEDRSFYWRLTGRQNLHFFASLYGLSSLEAKKKVKEVLGILEIEDKADINFQKYSSGIKQRMLIARSLLSDPQILFMDEATKSLDPYAACKLRRFIKEELVEKRKKTIFMTTHQMTEAEEICDRIAIMQGGRIKKLGTLEELRKETGATGAGLNEIFHKVIEPDTFSVREKLNVYS